MKVVKRLWAASAAVGLLLAGSSSQAIPLIADGSIINLSGTAELNNSDLGLATGFNGFEGVTVGYGNTGTYAGVTPGTSVTMPTGFSFSPSFSGSVIPLWTFMDSGSTYAFDLTGLTSVSQSSAFLLITGVGTLHVSNYGDVTGYWSFSSQALGPNSTADFTFSTVNKADKPVPDGGTTVMLLGSALALIGAGRRFWQA